MQWSKPKPLIEQRIAPPVRGRVARTLVHILSIIVALGIGAITGALVAPSVLPLAALDSAVVTVVNRTGDVVPAIEIRAGAIAATYAKIPAGAGRTAWFEPSEPVDLTVSFDTGDGMRVVDGGVIELHDVRTITIVDGEHAIISHDEHEAVVDLASAVPQETPGQEPR